MSGKSVKSCVIYLTNRKNQILRQQQKNKTIIRLKKQILELKNRVVFYFVKEIIDEDGDACVVEITVDEESSLEESKLGERKVGRTSRVATLLAEYAESDVGLLNH